MTYGIIAEFNPFHNGHKYILDKAKERSTAVVCAISGNFVQRGDTAVYPKALRARAALLSGADAVVEIPVVYSMSTAQNFALCGVWNLVNAGCDTIIFGSESGDIGAIKKVADILLSGRFREELKKQNTRGLTFAAVRESAAAACGADPKILRNPNDNLGVEYILAARRFGLNVSFEAVKRKDALHDGLPCGNFAGASYIRDLILKGDTSAAKKYMPPAAHFLLSTPASDIKYADRALISLLRSKEKAEFLNLPDLSEGIENRLYDSVKPAACLEDLYKGVKSKRYTLARVRRLVLGAALRLPDFLFLKPPPFTRILGSRKDTNFAVKREGRLCPVVTRVSEIQALGEAAKEMFAAECRASDIYALSFKDPLECDMEYKTKYIKV